MENPKSDNDSEYIRFKILFARLVLIIQSLPRFRVACPLWGDQKRRDKFRFCEYHKDVGHQTNFCFRLKRLLNYLVCKGNLQEYMESSAPNGSSSPSLSPFPTSQRPVIDTILAVPKLDHAWGKPHARIFVAGVKYSFALGSVRPIDGLLTFSKSSMQ